MRYGLLLFASLFSFISRAQNVEVFTGSARFAAGAIKTVESFGKGLVDYGFSGQLQTTAQFLKVNLGEPQGFYVPIYLLVGATSGDFGADKVNKGTILGLVNSTGGVVNLSGNFYANLYKSKSGITNLKFSTLAGAKVVSGRDSTSGGQLKPAAFIESGLYFQTGAWADGTDYQDGGVFWIQARYALIAMSQDDLKTFFGNNQGQMPSGPKIEMGIFIKDRVNVKLSFYKAITGKDIPTLGDSQFRIGLDYSVAK